MALVETFFYISRIKNFTDLSLGRWIYHLLDSCLLYCIILIAFWWRYSNRVSKTWLYKPEIWAQVEVTMPCVSILSPNSIYLPVITKESTIRGDITDLKLELRTRSQSSSCTFLWRRVVSSIFGDGRILKAEIKCVITYIFRILVFEKRKRWQGVVLNTLFFYLPCREIRWLVLPRIWTFRIPLAIWIPLRPS